MLCLYQNAINIWYKCLYQMLPHEWRCIHVVASNSTSCLYLAEWYSIIWMYPNFFIQSLVHGNLCCFYLLSIMNKAILNICVQVLFIFLSLELYIAVETLGQMITLYLVFWESFRLFSKVAAPLNILTSHIWVFWVLCILTNRCYYQTLW